MNPISQQNDFPATPQKAKVLLVDDQPQNLDILLGYLADSDLEIQVATSGEDALELMTQAVLDLKAAPDQKAVPDLILLDIMMPGMDGFEVCQRIKANDSLTHIPVIFMSALSDTRSRVNGFNLGAVDYVSKPLYREEVLARIHTQLTLARQQQELQARNQQLEQSNQELAQANQSLARSNHLLEQTNRDLQAQIERRQQTEEQLHKTDAALSTLTQREAAQWGIDAFIGESHQVLALLNRIRDLQPAQATNVLVLGESGTGKELVSRAIHYGSPRSKKPFIAVNCSAIPLELADAEFFGHTKGAFTGANQERRGYFEQADGGTLFLDEIGDMPLSLQIKLLRVLEDGLVTPIGSSKARQVNVRVIAATNVDLDRKMTDKEFRQDLYFRLAGYVLQLPALRERPGDIPLLAQHFNQQLSRQMAREPAQISSSAMQLLANHSYPGNIRELRNHIEFALIASRLGRIEPEHLPIQTSAKPATEGSPLPSSQDLNLATDRDETAHSIFNRDTTASTQEQQLLDCIQEAGKLNNAGVQEALKIDHNRASYLLKKLHKEGKLEKKGERRWSWYQLPSE